MKPAVSIAIPVYNGENYLARAIESVLAQTFTHYEIILNDNASTDRTREICEHYAAQDPRIHYYRHEVNRGATWNFNDAFRRSSGEYFCWLAHDDELAPDYLARCAASLDNGPEAVLCFSKVRIVDENSRPLGEFDVDLRTDSLHPRHRFYDLLMVWHDCLPIFGLIRASALKKTPLIGAYGLGDAVLLARLGLLGKFEKISGDLFYSRRHALQSNKKFNIWVDHHAYDRWFAPARTGRWYLPQWEVLSDLLAMVGSAEMGAQDRFFCFLAVARWAVRYRKLLIKDVVYLARRLLAPSKSISEEPIASQDQV